MQDLGDTLTQEKALLATQQGQQQGGRIYGQLFQYTGFDQYVTDPAAQNNVGTRALGAVQAAGGAAGVAGGAALCTSGVGCALGAVAATVGADYAQSGVTQAITGKSQAALGEQALQGLGMTPQAAAVTYGLLGIAPAAVDAAILSKTALATVNAVSDAASAQNIATARQLAQQLRLESAASPFTNLGTLKPETLKDAYVIIEADLLKNPSIPPGFAKYASDAYQSPAGAFSMHFYMHPETQEVYYGLDYKAIFNAKSGAK